MLYLVAYFYLSSESFKTFNKRRAFAHPLFPFYGVTVIGISNVLGTAAESLTVITTSVFAPTLLGSTTKVPPAKFNAQVGITTILFELTLYGGCPPLIKKVKSSVAFGTASVQLPTASLLIPAIVPDVGLAPNIFKFITDTCVVPPLVPSTLKECVPGIAAAPTVTVNVLCVASPGGGVAGDCEKTQVTFAGNPAQPNVTPLLKPFSDVIVHVLFANVFKVKVGSAVQPIVKSGTVPKTVTVAVAVLPSLSTTYIVEVPAVNVVTLIVVLGEV